MQNLISTRRFQLLRSTLFAAVAAALVATTRPAEAASQELYAFPTMPQDVNGSVVQALDGNFYGTSIHGGLYGAGTIFKVTPAGAMTVLFSFANTNGANPNASLVLAADGSLYGTAAAGGDSGVGTIFKITTGGIFTSLYSFTGGSDGNTPNAGLTLDPNGTTLYGTAYIGGAAGIGTVFSITTGGTFNVIGSFNFTHGYYPSGEVIKGSDGNFYGTTTSGGNGSGTVFVMGATGGLTNLFSFNGGNGASPDSGLVETSPGVFYGTTPGGGAYGKGTVFVVNSAGGFTNLISFDGTNGATPHDKLIVAPDHTLYGTTYNGGANDEGTIFKMTQAGVLTNLFTFNLANGANPFAELNLGNDGNLYGTTFNGQAGGGGTVFQITTNGALTTLASFTSITGAAPHAALTDGLDGKYYGVTYSGGTNNYGCFFNITPAGVLTPLFSFGLTNGANPAGQLLLGSNGNFFGTTYYGGANGLGTVFEITPSGSLVRSVSCTTNTGANPQAGLTLGLDGNYYGTASVGGVSQIGTVFRYTPAGVLASIHSFIVSEGYLPYAGLISDASGNLIGTTQNGGAHSSGTVFQITTNGTLTVLASFSNGVGANPQAGLIFVGGNYYGTAVNGGTSGEGTIYQMTPAGVITVMASLDDSVGIYPLAPLVAGADGNFYGTTSASGPDGNGSAFRMTPDGTVIPLLSFNGANGSGPVGGLIQAANGDLFGVTPTGSLGNGNVFKLLSLSASDPPLITSQPTSQTANAGQNAGFLVAAVSITDLGYQWFRGATALSNSGHYSGSTSSNLTILSITDADVDSYSVVLTNAAGGTTSAHVNLTVIDPPVITTQPSDILTNIGATITFQTVGTGGGLSYTWKRNGTALSNTGNVAGANTATLLLSSVQPADAGTYTVLLSNTAGITNSTPAILSLYNPPLITLQPVSVTNNVHETSVFHVAATSAIPLSYQWLKGSTALTNSSHIVGATASTLSVVSVTDPDVANYSVIVSNASGAVTSSPASLTVVDPPIITTQPVSVTTNAAATVNFQVFSTNVATTYQWKQGNTTLSNGGAISGATTPALTLTGVLEANAGTYTVQLNNSAGTTTSAPVTLTVADPFIVVQPASRTNNETTDAIFNVTANGTALNYQWRSNGVALSNGGKISGAQTSSLTVAAVVQTNAASYSVTVSGANGPLLSSNALLTVIDIPTIPTQPVSVATNAAATVTFHVGAASVNLSYQWKQGNTTLSNGGSISGATSATLTLTGVLAANEGTYTVHVTNSAGMIDSAPVTLSVVDPYIATQPLSRTNNEATTATFTVAAAGTSLGYQWRSNGVALSDGGKISGAQTSTLTVSAVVHSNAASYSVTVTGAKTPVTSSPAVLSVIDIPTIASAPASIATNAGATVNFAVAANSTGLGYQWRRNGANLTNGAGISGATTTNLTLLGIIEASAGSYTAHVTNSAGSVDSAPATLTVNDPFIAIQPASQSLNAGTTGLLSVTAYGTSLSYRWRSNAVALTDGGTVTGSTSSALTISNLLRASSATYSVQVTGFSGPVLSSGAVIIVADPAINGQPQDAGVNAGQTNVFSVDAGGSPTLRYQWAFSNNNTHVVSKLVGKTNATLTVGPIGASQIGGYRVIITNQLAAPNAVTSVVARLFFNVPPAIASPVAALTSAPVGKTVTLSLTASGTPPLSYQWLKNGAPIGGATTNKIIFTNAQLTDSATYQCTITNASGVNLTTVNTRGIVLVTNIPVHILTQPVNTNRTVGQSATLTIKINTNATPPVAFQWYKNSSPISGATTTTLSFPYLTVSNSGTYTCIITNPAGPVTTLNTKGVVTVTNTPIVFTHNPLNTNIVAGNNLTLTVKIATNATLPIAYQWAKDGAPISGATTTSLSFTNLQMLGSFFYTCTVTNPAGIFTTSTNGSSIHGHVTVLADTNKPSITHLNPVAGARLTNFAAYVYQGITQTAPVITFSGMVTDNGLITNVTIQRTFPSLGPVIPAGLIQTAPGAASYTNTFTLADGTNTFVISALDSGGNLKTNQVKFFFVNTNTPLGVVVAGTGVGSVVPVDLTLTPPYKFGTPTNNAYLEIGRGYEIKAIPGPNTIFSNWTDGHGTVLGTNLPLPFIMSSNLVLNANFLTNPIVAAGVNGAFNGLFYELDVIENPAVTERSAGMIGNLVVATNRVFSGRIFLNGFSNNFAGVFDLNGNADVIFSRASKGLSNLDISLSLDWQFGTKQITGTISNMSSLDPWSAPVLADLAVYSTNATYGHAGRFTMMLPPLGNAPENSPGGAGYAVITNSPSGKSTITGKLGDGVPISLTVPISKDGMVPFYQNLYNKQGLIIGWMTFPCDCLGGPDPSALPSGNLNWVRPATSLTNGVTSPTYSQGFTNVVTIFGSPYVPHAPALSGIGSLDMSDGDGLNLPLHFDVKLGTDNLITKVQPTTTNGLTASVTTATGLLNVTFHPTGLPSKTATGVVLQNLNFGYGNFIASTNGLGITNSGLIYLY